jgi:hypothetical protein
MLEMLLQGHILSTSGDALRGLKGGRKMPYENHYVYRKRVGPEGLMLFARMMTRTIAVLTSLRNFMQPMGRPKHALNVPCFLCF